MILEGYPTTYNCDTCGVKVVDATETLLNYPPNPTNAQIMDESCWLHVCQECYDKGAIEPRTFELRYEEVFKN